MWLPFTKLTTLFLFPSWPLMVVKTWTGFYGAQFCESCVYPLDVGVYDTWGRAVHRAKIDSIKYSNRIAAIKDEVEAKSSEYYLRAVKRCNFCFPFFSTFLISPNSVTELNLFNRSSSSRDHSIAIISRIMRGGY